MSYYLPYSYSNYNQFSNYNNWTTPYWANTQYNTQPFGLNNFTAPWAIDTYTADTTNTKAATDSISFQQKPIEKPTKKEEEKGLSTGAKLGIGALVLAGIGAAVYFATKARAGAKQVQQLAEQIEFKPAKTVDEAVKWGKQKLGVEYCDIDDVGTLNGINEWITGIHNKTKTIDKAAYPRFIANTKLEGNAFACLYDDSLKVSKNNEGYVMGINTSMIKDFDKTLERLSGNGSVISKSGNGKYQLVDEAYNTEFVRNLIDRMNQYNPKTTTFKEKLRIMFDIKGLSDGKFVNGKIQEVKYSDFYPFNHELGHLRHQENCTNYKLMKKIKKYTAQNEKIPDISKEFANNKSIQATAKKVSEYATESPAEFVAETFAGLLDGKTYSDDVMALYKKYDGPILS